MTRVLALDTSSRWGGVAVVQRDAADVPSEVVAEAGFLVRDHARHLLGWIDAVLVRVGLDRDGIDAFVATRGPGTFTGLRVGLGTVRGLAVATGKPCCGVGTLEAMAEAFGPAEAPRVPLLPAGRGEIYGASYDPGSVPPQERTTPMVGPAQAVFEATLRNGPAVVFGLGVADVSEALPATARVGQAPRGIAAAAARLALLSGCTPDSMSPLYLRPPDAVLKR